MNEYTEYELRNLIEKYHREMMEQYAQNTVQSTSAQTPPLHTAEEPTESDTAVRTEPTINDLTDIGYLQIRVSTEDQAIPLEGAVVTVTHQQNDTTVLDRSLITDKSGLTPIIELATKNRSLSLSPGNVSPFAVYTVTVDSEGYFPKTFIDLPIYGGVTAIQSVSMIPLPEAGGDDITLSYLESGPSL